MPRRTLVVFLPGRRADPDRQRRLIELSGDVHPNPGPNRDQGALGKEKGVWRVAQMNVNGWKSRRLAVLKALEDWAVDVAVISESNMRPSDDVSAPGFTCHRMDRVSHRGGGQPGKGGLLTLVRTGVAHKMLDHPLSSVAGAAVEAQAVELSAPGSSPLRLLNLYRPPVRGGEADRRDGGLHTEVWPVDRSWLILGDVNAHGSWDDAKEEDAIGLELEEWMEEKGWTYFNSGEATRVCPRGGESAPDVSLGHGHWLGRVVWRVMPTIGSDHLPILLDVRHGPAHQEARRGPTKWALTRADWKPFRDEVTREFQGWRAETYRSVDAAAGDFARRLLRAARVLPRGSRASPKAWWSKRCEEARAAHRAAASRLRADPGEAAAAEARRARERAEAVYAEEKRASWEAFTRTLDPDTPSSKIWSTIRDLDGRGRQPLPDTPIDHEGRLARTPREKAELAMATYASVSRVMVPRAESGPALLEVRRAVAASGAAPPQPEESMFHMAELRAAIFKAKGRSAGHDNIPPALLKNLPVCGLQALLGLANRSWEEGRVPASWRKAVIAPRLKNGKPAEKVKSYRPVSLLSVVGKCVEGMVAARLASWAEARGVIPEAQSGFRAGRSTLDCLVSLAQEAFDNMDRTKPAFRTLVAALDLRAAFDRVWRAGLLRHLSRCGVPGRWLRWLRGFLSDRRARVRWGEVLGGWRVLKEGVPQGSPLSPILFVLFLAPMCEEVSEACPDCRMTVYADDVTLSAAAANPVVAGERVQAGLSAVEKWCGENFVELAPEKSEALLLTVDPRQVNAKCAPRLVAGGQELRHNPQPVVLGVKLDSQLGFGAHASDAAKKMRQRCQMLRALAARNWGAATHSLRRVYTAYVRPAGLYGAGVWWSFLAPSHRRRLESVNYSAARTIAGVAAGSRAVTTVRDVGLPPLNVVASSEAARLLAHTRRFPEGHRLRELAEGPGRPARLKGRSGEKRTSWRTSAAATLAALGIDGPVEARLPPELVPPPWLARSSLRFVAVADTSREEAPEVRGAKARAFLGELREECPPSLEIWTDGSAKGGTANGGGGFIIDGPGWSVADCVPAGSVCSSTAAEAAALAAALEVAAAGDQGPGPVWVAFDSSALWHRLQNPRGEALDHNMARALDHLRTMSDSKEVLVIWVPGHCGVRGNERADEQARRGGALLQPETRPSFSSLVARLGRGEEELVRREYDAAVPEGNLHRRLGGEPLALDGRRSREADVAVFRLRANRAPFLKSTLVKWGREEDSTCPHCDIEEEDTEHFLLRCPKWQQLRQKHAISSVEDLNDGKKCAAFLWDAGVLKHPPYSD